MAASDDVVRFPRIKNFIASISNSFGDDIDASLDRVDKDANKKVVSFFNCEAKFQACVT